MNAQTSLARRSVEELRDYRSDEQRLRDAVDASIAAQDALNAIGRTVGPVDERLFGEAEKAAEDAQAQLFILVEDLFCVDPRKLLKALS